MKRLDELAVGEWFELLPSSLIGDNWIGVPLQVSRPPCSTGDILCRTAGGKTVYTVPSASVRVLDAIVRARRSAAAQCTVSELEDLEAQLSERTRKRDEAQEKYDMMTRQSLRVMAERDAAIARAEAAELRAEGWENTHNQVKAQWKEAVERAEKAERERDSYWNKVQRQKENLTALNEGSKR